MATGNQSQPVSKAAWWTGLVLGIVASLLLVMSAVGKFQMTEQVVQGFEHLGWQQSAAIGLGIVELTCLVIYWIPQTAVLGAILLSGYLGGAIATHVRVSDPVPHVAIPAVVAIVLWLGLYLREPRLRALTPLRT